MNKMVPAPLSRMAERNGRLIVMARPRKAAIEPPLAAASQMFCSVISMNVSCSTLDREMGERRPLGH
jgi:hypothetical protein